MQRSQAIRVIVQEVASRHEVFVSRGEGAGNKVTNAAMAEINRRVAIEVGAGLSDVRLTSKDNQTVDFFVPEERAVIEVEFSLANPYPCLQKDLFKVLLAKDSGVRVEKLVLMGDPGSKKRMSSPTSKAILDWAMKHGVEVTHVELE